MGCRPRLEADQGECRHRLRVDARRTAPLDVYDHSMVQHPLERVQRGVPFSFK